MTDYVIVHEDPAEQTVLVTYPSPTYMAEATETMSETEAMEALAQRVLSDHTKTSGKWAIIPAAEVPTDQTFRNAWRVQWP